MSDRTILEYEEDNSGSWTMRIEYSASGKPDVFVVLDYIPVNGDQYSDQLSVLVKDAPKVFAPLIEWLKTKENE